MLEFDLFQDIVSFCIVAALVLTGLSLVKMLRSTSTFSIPT